MTDDHRLANAEPAEPPEDAPRDENDDPIFDDGEEGETDA